MKFVLGGDEEKRKFAWIPVCISSEGQKTVWIWLESYTERVEKMYGFGGTVYHRESKSGSGTVRAGSFRQIINGK